MSGLMVGSSKSRRANCGAKEQPMAQGPGAFTGKIGKEGTPRTGRENSKNWGKKSTSGPFEKGASCHADSCRRQTKYSEGERRAHHTPLHHPLPASCRVHRAGCDEGGRAPRSVSPLSFAVLRAVEHALHSSHARRVPLGDIGVELGGGVERITAGRARRNEEKSKHRKSSALLPRAPGARGAHTTRRRTAPSPYPTASIVLGVKWEGVCAA